MSLLAELKRRNVIRMGGLYLVGAWLLVQVAGTLLPLFGAPGWTMRTLVIVLALLFLPALVFAWVFELTPEGIKRDEEVPLDKSIGPQTARRMDRMIIAVLMLALVYFGFDKFVLAPRREASAVASAQQQVAGKPAAMIDDKSIAVMPFADLSQERDQEYFSDGMAEEILNALSRVESLKVVGRASSFTFKGKSVSPQQVGEALAVANILQGSVRKQGDLVRITATLIRTADGVQQWSRSYDGKLSDIFDLQDSCARDIAEQMKVVLVGGNERRLVDKATDNPEAYALFIEAQTRVNERVGDNLPRAITMLEKATALDPEFARAWSKLAVALAVRPQYVGGDWVASWIASEKAAHRAIALDPQNAEAYATLGYINLSRRDYLRMIEPTERALALGPNDLTANFWGANQLTSMGRLTDADALIDRSLVQDPASRLLIFYKANLRWGMGDAATANSFAKRAQALGDPLSGLTLSYQAAANKDFDGGAKYFARAMGALGSKLSSSDLALVFRGTYQGESKRQEALAMLAANASDEYVPTLLLMLGEPERSFDAFEHGSTGLSDAYFAWVWQPEDWSRKARQSPAFQGFAKRLGMVAYWKRTKWPDLCQPAPDLGPDSFTCQ